MLLLAIVVGAAIGVFLRFRGHPRGSSDGPCRLNATETCLPPVAAPVIRSEFCASRDVLCLAQPLLREVGQKQSREEQVVNMRCHHCKELGHRKANCPKPRTRPQPKPEQKAITELVGLLADLKKNLPGPPVPKTTK